MVGGSGVQGRYGEVGISMRGMARLRKAAASCWAGVSCARVSWARMLFSARVDGIGPSSSSEETIALKELINKTGEEIAVG